MKGNYCMSGQSNDPIKTGKSQTRQLANAVDKSGKTGPTTAALNETKNNAAKKNEDGKTRGGQ